MSSSKNPQQSPGNQSSTLPPSDSESGIDSEETISQEATQLASRMIRTFIPNLKASDDPKLIQECLFNLYSLVNLAIGKGGNQKLKERLRNEVEFKDLVKPGSNVEQELVKLLGDLEDKDFEDIKLFKHEAFLKTKSKEEKVSDLAALAIDFATTLAWRGKYKGDLARVLFLTIADYLSLEKTPYARVTSIINSSGTGKSRMVDELGRVVITVPMCLRPQTEHKDTGFPRTDEELRNWLIYKLDDRDIVQRRLHAFVYSLLLKTEEELRAIVVSNKEIPESPCLNGRSVKDLSKKRAGGLYIGCHSST